MHKDYWHSLYVERGRHSPCINVREIPWLVILMTFTLLFHDELWNCVSTLYRHYGPVLISSRSGIFAKKI